MTRKPRSAVGAWTERALYLSLLWLASDAAPPIPTAANTASEMATLLEAGALQTLHEDHLGSTSWRRKSLGSLALETAGIRECGRVLDIVPIEVTHLQGDFQIVAESCEWHMHIAITEDGSIIEFDASKPEPIPPLAPSPPLALPVRGEWKVSWAGSDESLDLQSNERSLRRALRFTIVDADDKTHRGDGLANHDYYAYGQPIHAMAAGEVVMVVDGVPDNEPGQRGPYRLGNTIVIRQQENLHAVYALLIPGSTTVNVGDHVERGQILGKCGNSGRTREPRVHIHLQDDFVISKGWGVEPIFADAIVEREGVRTRMGNVSLGKGDLVTNTN